jgi:MFS family permease
MAGAAGTLFGGMLTDIYGRRCNNITANGAMVLGWLLIAAAQEKFMILFGRIIEGFFRSMLLTGLTVRPQENIRLVL